MINILNTTLHNEGYEKGEKCNRYCGHFLLKKCDGIIDEYDSDTSCSCHLGNPPCSHCYNSRSYCPKCDWDGYEQQNLIYIPLK